MRPDGRGLAPVMPRLSCVIMTDEDMAALVAYLRSLPSVAAPRLDPVETADAARAPFYRVTLPSH